MSRSTWRNIFIGIIIMTIPCYIFGIAVYYFQESSAPTPTATQRSVPTINVTELALTDPSLRVSPISLTAQASITPLNIGVTPLLPTGNGLGVVPIVPTTGNGSGVVPIVPTSNATQFLTNTPLPPTSTPTPTRTPTPTETQPILLPPTNTPSP